MRRDLFLPVALVAFFLVCVAAGARQVVHLDSVPLLLALEHQDLRLHQPQPPGYILHVWLAEIVHVLTGRPVLALRCVSLLVLLATAGLLYRLALRLADRATARATVLLFLTSPLVLFHGMTTGTYGDEALAGVALSWMLLRALERRQPSLRAAAYLTGLLAGLRPTVLVFGLPLLVWAGRRLALSRRGWAEAGLASFLGALCWLVPQAQLAGGLDDYVRLLGAVARPALEQSPLWKGPLPLAQHFLLLAATLFFGLGGARWIATLGARLRRRRGAEHRPATEVSGFAPSCIAVWILPPALASLLLGMPATGYALALWPPLCLWLAHSWQRWWQVRRAPMAALLLFDLALFFGVPTPASRPAPGLGMAALLELVAPAKPDPLHAWWDGQPAGVRRAADALFAKTDFFFDRTRHADFAPLQTALHGLGRMASETLVLGGPITRAACVLAPWRDVLHCDPYRPVPFLHYRERHATVVADSFEVPPEIFWLLLEGNPQEIQRADAAVLPPASPDAAAELAAPASSFHLRPLGEGPIDLWFVPEAAEGKLRLHLVRRASPTDPKLYERADASGRRHLPPPALDHRGPEPRPMGLAKRTRSRHVRVSENPREKCRAMEDQRSSCQTRAAPGTHISMGTVAGLVVWIEP